LDLPEQIWPQTSKSADVHGAEGLAAVIGLVPPPLSDMRVFQRQRREETSKSCTAA